MSKVLLLPFLLLLLSPPKTMEQPETAVLRKQIFDKTNALRTEKGLPELQWNSDLMFLAQTHSENMVNHQFYAHTDHLGRSVIQRAEAMGIQDWVEQDNLMIGISENIAQVPQYIRVSDCGDTRTDEAYSSCMVDGWRDSPPHYANILGDFTELGVGLAFDERGMGFGTLNFR